MNHVSSVQIPYKVLVPRILSSWDPEDQRPPTLKLINSGFDLARPIRGRLLA